MARRMTLLELLDNLTPDIRAAFVESIYNIRGDTHLAALEQAIAAGDVEGALRVLALGQEYFAPLDRAMRSAYQSGGDLAMASLMAQAHRQGVAAAARFDDWNPRAEAYLTREGGRLITEVLDSTMEAARSALLAGMEANTAPRTAALDLVGRINRATGRREGGIIGLTSQQEGWARSAFDELTSGEPALMRSYLRRSRETRDARFDRTVLAAIRGNRPVPKAEAKRIVRAYRNGLLRYRGNNIARTELLSSLHAAQDEGVRQLIERGQVGTEAVTREWDAAGDSATRDSHRAMDGQQKRPDEPFTTGNGYRMRYPGDNSLGAPAEEIINCRCVVHLDVDFLSGIA